MPIRRAIEINGEAQAGSNLEARFARGLDNLTIRPLDTSMPPDESWVALTYRSRKGEILTLKQEWSVYTAGATPLATKATIKKRAAIDIVYHRLRQQGLDELCCLIHDSQTDKKAFIQDLKQTYESSLSSNESVSMPTPSRAPVLSQLRCGGSPPAIASC